MAAPDLTDLNNYFATRKNQFDQNIYAEYFRTDPHASMFTRKPFDLEGGRIPEVITATHELPSAYPFGLTKVTLSSGTGDPACDVPATLIKHGYKTRSYQLEQAAFETPVFCLTDLQFKYQLVEQVKNVEMALTEFATVFMSDWHRVQNIGMLNTKVSTTGNATVSMKSDALYDFSTLTLPTYELNWSHLNTLYDMAIRRGAGRFAIGTAMGQPVLSLSVGPGYKRLLYQDDEEVRETINYSKDSEQNFIARGISKAVNGYAPNVDEFPIRYAADGTTAIYPTLNQATTSGYESVPNPNYLTVDNGGTAVYEVVTILVKDIYEVHPRPVGPLGAGKQKFDATSYAGEANWINNKDMGANKLGNKGLYRLDFQLAPKPIRPQHGFSILTLARD